MPSPGAAFTQSASYRYHCFTKHSVASVMSSAWSLDWENQPDPFRRYAGAEAVALPHEMIVSREDSLTVLLRAQHRASLNESESRIADVGSRWVSSLLFYSLAISAWKEIRGTEHRWALRVNPSSGNLHPTEAHLLCRGLTGVANGAYHYASRDHALERRATGDFVEPLWKLLSPGEDAGPRPPLLVVLTSIFWREAWKYRHRAYRYCNLDAGHAAAAVLVAATSLGWEGTLCGRFPDAAVEELLHLGGTDERPLLILALRPGHAGEAFDGGSKTCPSSFAGAPNALSADPLPYETIDDAHAAGALPAPLAALPIESLPDTSARLSFPERVAVDLSISFAAASGETGPGRPIHRVVRTRRSAVDHDGATPMSRAEFACILSTATRGIRSDFLRSGRSGDHFLVHLFAYVHRVRGVETGLYAYDRVAEALVPLALGDQRSIACGLSLGQEIAADACFALSLIADLESAHAIHGERGYRFVHQEAGAIGQLLYLAAEALGYQSTGIGAFFDDDVNRRLDLPAGFEVVYHFCVGRAVEDPRLTTLPAYEFPDPALQEE
jgi:SagB-type dehydrogenase family enzyme